MNTIQSDYFCPACGYRLDFAPWDKESASDEICPSCGIQFGYDDFADGDISKRRSIYISWRKNWIDNGMKWFSKGRKQPKDWDPVNQLKDFL